MTLEQGLLILVSALTMIATGALAYTGWRTFRLNAQLLDLAGEQFTALGEEVQAVKAQAEASQRTVEEMRQDREHAHAPHLRITVRAESAQPRLFEVENIGRGPALNCRLAHVEFSGDPRERRLYSTELFPLAPGQTKDPWVAAASRWQDNILADLHSQAPESPDGITACVCEDQLGIKRRFVAGRPLQGVSGELMSPDPPPDIWRPGDPEVSWGRWYS